MTRAVRIARSSGLLGLLPKRLKLWARARLDFEAIHQAEWRASYDKIIERAQVADAVTTSRVCIVRDWMLRHAYYEAACRELGVPYEVLDLTTPDWLEKIARTDFAVYFVRPFVLSPLGRALYEERTWFLEHVLKKNVFPGFEALWPYESKRRCAALLEHHQIPHPRTWVFFSRAEALEFVATASYPLVFKTDLGSDAVGVRILRRRADAERLVRQCFSTGYRSNFYDPRDVSFGQILLQEHVGDVLEWRVIRIGHSYFAYQKGKKGEFHSGSKIGIFADPPERLLDLTREATERIGVDSVAVDVFEDASGRHLVNEVQTYYGANEPSATYYQDGVRVYLGDKTVEMMVRGRPGRYLREQDRWVFEEGDFARNAGCNLRVKLAFQRMGTPLPGYTA